MDRAALPGPRYSGLIEPMRTKIERVTVDLSAFPDLVVFLLGMQVNTWTGVKTLIGFGPKISQAVEPKPEGLLAHETMLFSLRPLHLGYRQYWRDFESLEAWARSDPHKEWWRGFLSDTRGTGFWHELYFMRGGMEAVYDDMKGSLGFTRFAPTLPARGPMFSARERLRAGGEPQIPSPVPEDVLYEGGPGATEGG
jgi:hypothetical protein